MAMVDGGELWLWQLTHNSEVDKDGLRRVSGGLTLVHSPVRQLHIADS